MNGQLISSLAILLLRRSLSSICVIDFLKLHEHFFYLWILWILPFLLNLF